MRSESLRARSVSKISDHDSDKGDRGDRGTMDSPVPLNGQMSAENGVDPEIVDLVQSMLTRVVNGTLIKGKLQVFVFQSRDFLAHFAE
jgi:hypothetical protein